MLNLIRHSLISLNYFISQKPYFKRYEYIKNENSIVDCGSHFNRCYEWM